VTRRKIRYGLASLASNSSLYELIVSCISLIVVNVQTRMLSNPSKALENVGIVLLGPMLADTDDAVEEEVVVGEPILADTDDAVEEEVMVVGGRR
jgi:hypothetical protein